MRRREFLGILGGTAAAWPFAAQAQQQQRMRRIAVLTSYRENDTESQVRLAAFRRGLQEQGWFEGRNLVVEYRWAAGDSSVVRAAAAEIARLAPEVILTNGTPVTRTMQRETSTIPIVFANATDPVGSGLVASLAKPGGNTTGFTNYEFSIAGKWLETLREIAPQVRRLLVLSNPGNTTVAGLLRHIEAAVTPLGIELKVESSADAGALEKAIHGFADGGPGAGLLMLPDATILVHRAVILRTVERRSLPAIYPFRHLIAEGGLVSYGVDASDVFRRAPEYISRILKGEQPAVLPVQNPTKFELVINLKTAKALGLVIPPTLLARADEVIE
jgi:putative tryptophan/tyrosine transport system substrate-binding protein